MDGVSNGPGMVFLRVFGLCSSYCLWFLQWSLGFVPNGFGKVLLRAFRVCFEWSYESDLNSHQKVFLVVSECVCFQWPLDGASTGLWKVVLGVFECLSNGL